MCHAIHHTLCYWETDGLIGRHTHTHSYSVESEDVKTSRARDREG